MTDLFENPTVPMDQIPKATEICWTRVEIRLRSLILVRNLISSLLLIPLVLGFVFIYLIERELMSEYDYWMWSALAWMARIVLSLLIVFLLTSWFVFPFFEVPRRRYAVREEDISYHRGLFRTRTSSTPFKRMQHATTVRGVFDRMFDLATLNIFTAAGQAFSIQGLSPDTAEKLRHHVLEQISRHQQVESPTDQAMPSDELEE